MKKLFSIILIVVSLSLSAQDSTIATLSIKARLVQTLAPFVKNGDDTSSINLMIRWIKKWDVVNPPSGTTQVVVDSVSVILISALYNKAKSYPQGAASVGDDFESDVAAIRAANPYLDKLLDDIDVIYNSVVPDSRTRGRKLLTGKN